MRSFRKLIIKANKAKKGIVEGTGAGTPHSTFEAEKFSRTFVLKDGSFQKRYECINVKTGDTVCFAY